MAKIFSITSVGLSDVSELKSIARATFREAFAGDNLESNLESYIQHSFSEAQLSSELKNINSKFFFLRSDHEIAGYLKINSPEAQANLNHPDSLEIERIYVFRRFQGRGGGRLLFEEAKKIARKNQFKFIWLAVWEKNQKAIGFYKKQGFHSFGEQVFEMGDENQRDILMKYPLIPK